MTIFKRNAALVFLCSLMLLNVTPVSSCCDEPASDWYRDKVHEFLYYFGVENAYDVAVYKISLQEEAKYSGRVSVGKDSGIWINERMWLSDPLIKTEQDVVGQLAMAAAFYAFGLNNFLLRWCGLSILSTAPVVVTNVLLALFARCSYAKSCTFKHKLLIGLVANIGAIFAVTKLYKYLTDKNLSPYMQKQFEEIHTAVIQMLCAKGYWDEAEAYKSYLKAKLKKEA